jgi:hypothetical protein
MKLLPEFEHNTQPVVPLRVFLLRLVRSGLLALVLVLVSLSVGMLGYHGFEGLGWTDAFLNASMILGGMGPVDTLHTEAGKLFAGAYALYSGLIVIAVAGILLTPVIHRLLHKFHASR